LNRILSQDPSQILGRSAPTAAYFCSIQRHHIRASARVNVGSLVASSLDLTGSDAIAIRFIQPLTAVARSSTTARSPL